MEAQRYDFLKKYTKDEIISALNSSMHYTPVLTEKDMLCIRWTEEVKKYEALKIKATAYLQSIDGKKRDELAKEFNSCNSYDTKASIYQQITAIDRQLKHYRALSEKAAVQWEKSQKAYKAYMEYKEEL